MKKSHIIAHMKTAYIYAELSHCTRKKVGCVVVKGDNILSIGWNGTPPEWNNTCEGPDGLTLPEVSHAEENAIGKLAKQTGGGEGSTVFITCAPCFPCAKLLRVAGIKKLYYGEIYGNHTEGLEYLKKCGVEIELLKVEI